MCGKHRFRGKGPCGTRVVAKHSLWGECGNHRCVLGRVAYYWFASLESAGAESNNQLVYTTSEILSIIASANRIQVGTLAYAHDVFAQAHVHIL